MHDVPVEGTVRPTEGDYGAFDRVQYSIEVPPSPELDAGEAKLELELVNLTDRNRNIDLIVRVEEPVEIYVDALGRCLIRADYFARSDFGEERLVIDADSDPPLEATTYFVAVLNFEFDRPGPQDYRLTAKLTPPPPPPCPTCFLVSGEARSGTAEAQSLTPKDEQFILEIPTGVRTLALSFINHGQGSLNLHLRFGRPIEVNDGEINADFSLLSPSGPFFIAGDQLRGGTLLFLAVENPEGFEQPFELTALLMPEIRRLRSDDLGQVLNGSTGTERITDESLREIVARQLQTAQGRLSLAQYAVSASQTMRGLKIELSGESPGVLRLHIRLGKPVEISAGRVIADLSASVDELSGTVSLSSALFQTGIYYLAVESLGEAPQSFTLVVQTQGGSE